MDIDKGPLMQAVSLQAIVDSKYPAVIRAAAAKLMECDYLNVGDFLKELPQSDLEDLSTRCSRVITGVNSDADFDCLILLGCMLCQSEGCTLDGGTVQSRTSNLIILITFEELERKGVVEFHREKATLCNEFLDEGLARIK